ncbi:unnamed protein product [Caenorhabditis nigoni]
MVEVYSPENEISELLTLNLKSVRFIDDENPFKLESSDLLMTNISNLSITTAKITEKELNRFLKLWMKSNHRFYKPKYIELFLEKRTGRREGSKESNILRGVKYRFMGHKRQLRREDGKELLISIRGRSVTFDFRG